LKDEEFVNPQPPPNYRPQTSKDETSNSQPMTNADFRKLLMTPAAGTHRLDASVRSSNKPSATPSSSSQKFIKQKANHDLVEKRKLKKLYYASLMKEIKEREEELSKKYRDRAKERREASTSSKTSNEHEYFNTTAIYHAVGPELNDQVDSRRRLIEESKYLGGDLEHTHLVKGLDYALLQKVRAELDQKEALEAQKDANNYALDDLKEAGDEEDDEEQTKNIKKLQMKLEALKTELKLVVFVF
jgi:IK cytokine